MSSFHPSADNGLMTYRVRYRHLKTGEVTRFPPMSREDALEVARQLICDGGREVQIEDGMGQSWPVEELVVRYAARPESTGPGS